MFLSILSGQFALSTFAQSKLSPQTIVKTEKIVWSKKKKVLIEQVTQELNKIESSLKLEIANPKYSELADSLSTSSKELWSELSPKIYSKDEDNYGEVYKLFFIADTIEDYQQVADMVNPYIKRANSLFTIFRDSELNIYKEKTITKVFEDRFLDIGDEIITKLCGRDQEICKKLKQYKFKNQKVFAGRTYHTLYDLLDQEMNEIEDGKSDLQSDGFYALISKLDSKLESLSDDLYDGILTTLYSELQYYQSKNNLFTPVIDPMP
jgi:uncharacterized membrane protein YfbV (UPF0208 family)